MRAGTPAQHLHASRWGVRPPGAPCPTLVFSLTSAAVPACASAAAWCLSCLGLLSGHSWGSLHSCSPGVGKPFALLPQHFVYSLTVPSLSHIVGHWPCAARSMGHTVFYSVLCKARPQLPSCPLCSQSCFSSAEIFRQRTWEVASLPIHPFPCRHHAGLSLFPVASGRDLLGPQSSVLGPSRP